ncbi:MAG: hypothetical protein ACYSUP_18185 [Planctomycetota bacterium]|jgi:hypothetical protein
MSEIRDAILRQMLQLGLSIYQVSKLVKDDIPQRTVYAFLAGEKDAGTETASAIMKAVGLTVKSIDDKSSYMDGIKMKEKRKHSLRGRAIQEWENAGRPNWSPRELLGVCLLADLELGINGLDPAPKFRKAVESKNYNYLITWAQGLKFASWK